MTRTRPRALTALAALTSTAATSALALTLVPSPAAAAPGASDASPRPLSGEVLSTYDSGFFDEGGAEIVAYAAKAQRAFVVNSGEGTVDVLDLSDPTDPRLVGRLDTPGANSVAVHGVTVAVAQQAENRTEAGTVAFFGARSLRKVREVGAGALPDMVTFAKGGRFAVVANEGEPEGYCTGQTDPVGSVTVVDLRRGVRDLTVRQAGFGRFRGQADALRAAGVRLFGPGASVAQDLEPEYVATSGNRAFVTMQENNAVAVVNIPRGRVTRILPLGLKDHAAPGNGLDPSDRDGGAVIATWPVAGMFQPDAIDVIPTGRGAGTSRNGPLLITANEGDAREYDCLLDDSEGVGEPQAEDARVGDLDLDPTVFGDADERGALQDDAALGRLGVSLLTSPRGADGYTALHALGARSVTIWNAGGRQVWDSGDLLERVTEDLPIFNADNDEAGSADSRSDAKGPEPEGIVVGTVGRRTYAFVGLERTSAVAVLDVTRPRAPRFQSLLVNRDDSVPADADAAGDLGPEGLAFVPAADSPSGRALLLVGNEVSGTTTVWGLSRR